MTGQKVWWFLTGVDVNGTRFTAAFRSSTQAWEFVHENKIEEAEVTPRTRQHRRRTHRRLSVPSARLRRRGGQV